MAPSCCIRQMDYAIMLNSPITSLPMATTNFLDSIGMTCVILRWLYSLKTSSVLREYCGNLYAEIDIELLDIVDTTIIGANYKLIRRRLRFFNVKETVFRAKIVSESSKSLSIWPSYPIDDVIDRRLLSLPYQNMRWSQTRIYRMITHVENQYQYLVCTLKS